MDNKCTKIFLIPIREMAMRSYLTSVRLGKIKFDNAKCGMQKETDTQQLKQLKLQSKFLTWEVKDTFVPTKNNWQCLETLLLSQLGWRCGGGILLSSRAAVSQQRILLPKMSIMLSLRNPELELQSTWIIVIKIKMISHFFL